MIRYLLQLILLGIAVSVIYQLLSGVLPARFFFTNYFLIAPAFVLITTLFHAGLVRSHQKGGKEFIRYYMGATAAKLFLFLTIILIYAFLHKVEAVAFALCFFVYYFTFTAYEVAVAYRLFGAQSTKQ